MKCKETIQSLSSSNKDMNVWYTILYFNNVQGHLLIDEVTKKRNVTEMETAKEKATEYKMEAAKYWNELQKLRPVMKELKEKNVAILNRI